MISARAMQSSGRVEGNSSDPVSSKIPMAMMVASSAFGTIPLSLRISTMIAMLEPYSLLVSRVPLMSSADTGW